MTAIPRQVSFGMGRKYHNKPTVLDVDGKSEKFDSIREAKAFRDLQLLEKAGRIRNLTRERDKVTFVIKVGDKKVCSYRADFVYEEYLGGQWRPVVADAKGFPTPVYKLKRKLMEVVMGIVIREL